MRTLHKGFLLISVPVIAELLFVGVLLMVYRDSEEQSWRELRFRTEAAKLAELNMLFDKSAGVLVVYGVSQDPIFLTQYRGLALQMQANMDSLAALISERLDRQDEERLERFNKLRSKMESQMSTFENLAFRPAQFSRDEQLAVINNSRLGNEELLEATRAIFQDKSRLDAPSADSLEKKRAALFGFIAFGVIANLLIAFVVLYLFAKEFAGRVDVLVDNARKLPRNEPLNEPLTGSDELGLLDSVFHKMALELKENSQRREQLMAMVSHDLRTPLLAAHMSAELLKEGAGGALEPSGRSLVERINRTLSRLITLVSDILDLEKLRAGKMQLELGTHDISGLMDDTVGEVQALLLEKNISISNNCAALVVADRERIMQVLVNLLSNAIKFSPTNSTITVSSRLEEETVTVAIDDEGSGVAAEYKEIVFLPFEQCPVGLRSGVKGTGLGLPICKFIVDLHGGKIGIEDIPGKGGSRFWFTLPAAIIEEL